MTNAIRPRSVGRYVPPTQPMVRFARSLARERAVSDLGLNVEERLENLEALLENRTYDKWQFMDLIDALKAAPRDDVAVESGDTLVPGVYERNGQVFVVRWNHARTNLYAKVMRETHAERLNANDERVRVEFDYAPGAIRQLRPGDQMPLDRAKELTLRYGRCVNCGRTLKAAKSVEEGIGPVCRKAFR